MKKIKYIFLAVATILVTVFYIINIKGKDQQIIAERLPNAVLIANNEKQNPETIPSPREVIKDVDDYARKHDVFIVMDVVTPNGSGDFKPTYMTFGKGKLASNMTLLPKEKREEYDPLGMFGTYNIFSGKKESEEFSQY